MRRLPSFSALAAFEAAARLGSFKKAADELLITSTAVSHRIRLLEEQLETSLFRRSKRGVFLTDEGLRLYPGISEAFDGIARSVGEIRASKLQVLTLTATSAFCARWLVPRLTKLQADLPEVDLRLLASDDPIDLHRSQVDLAIRYGQGAYPGLDSTLLMRDTFAPLAHPRFGDLSSSALEQAPLIRFDWRNPHPAHPTWEAWFSQSGVVRRLGAREYSFSDESHAIQAAISGQGIVLASLVLLQHELSSGILKRADAPSLQGLAYFVVHKPFVKNTRKRAKLELVRNWLIEEAANSLSLTDPRT